MRLRLIAPALLLTAACELVFNTDNLHPSFSGPDGSLPTDGGPGGSSDAGNNPSDGGSAGGSDSGAPVDAGGSADSGGPADAGGAPDAGTICFGPFDAGCPVLCILDLTGTFTGVANLAAARGPAAGADVSSVGFTVNNNAWIGIASSSGVTLTRQIQTTGRITSLAVSEGHLIPGTSTPCAEADAVTGGGGELFTSDLSGGPCTNQTDNLAGTAAASIGWMPGSQGHGLAMTAAGAFASTLDEYNFPYGQTTSSTSVSSGPQVEQVTALSAYDWWLITFANGSAQRFTDPNLAQVGTSFNDNSAPTSGSAAAQTSFGSAVIADYDTSGTLWGTLLTSGTTPYTIAGASGYSGAAGLQMTRWTGDGGTDKFLTTSLWNGEILFSTWKATPSQLQFLNFRVGDGCAPQNVIWAAPLSSDMLLTLRRDGGVALTPLTAP